MTDIEKKTFAEKLSLEHAESELKELGALHPFPEDGLERYESLMERIGPLREKIASLKHRIDSENELASKIKKSSALTFADRGEELSQVEKKLASIDEREARLRFLNDDISKRERALADETRLLFPSLIDLDSVVMSPAVIKQAETFRKELRDIETQSTDLAQNVKNEKQKRQQLEEELANARKQLTNMSPASIEALQSDVVAIRENFLRSEEIKNEIRSLETSRNEFFRQLDDVEYREPIPELRYMFLLNFLFSVICGFAAYASERYSVFALVIVLLFFTASFVLYRIAKMKDSEAIDTQYEEMGRKEMVIDSLAGKIVKLERQQEIAAKEIAERAKRLEMSHIENLGSIEELSERLELARLKLRSYTDVNQRASALIGYISDSRARQALYEKELARIVSLIDYRTKSWADWLVKMNFPASMPPEGFDSFVTRLNALKSKLESLNAVRREAQSEKTFISATHEAVQKLCGAMRIAPASLNSVFNSLKDVPSLNARLNEIGDNITKISSERKACEETLALSAAEVQSLFAEANVDTESKFRAQAALWEQKWMLEATRTEKFRNISVLLGGRSAAEKYIKEG